LVLHLSHLSLPQHQ